ncbi:hypothetical protein H2204_001608 [Knufia peltigerae]|uniref:C2H2-type domain-containing protein n=1 Tax=Knufia peltigerae TaxID=1002370 RepID=A0AA38YCK3_9EURO|nr:hypothetical protein H2204_001608 [Knufia peltigerae]
MTIDWVRSRAVVFRILAATYAVFGEDAFKGRYQAIARLYGPEVSGETIELVFKDAAVKAAKLIEQNGPVAPAPAQPLSWSLADDGDDDSSTIVAQSEAGVPSDESGRKGSNKRRFSAIEGDEDDQVAWSPAPSSASLRSRSFGFVTKEGEYRCALCSSQLVDERELARHEKYSRSHRSKLKNRDLVFKAREQLARVERGMSFKLPQNEAGSSNNVEAVPSVQGRNRVIQTSRAQSEIRDTIEVTRYPSKPKSAPRLANGIGPKPPIPARRPGLSSPPSSPQAGLRSRLDTAQAGPPADMSSSASFSPSPNPNSTHPAPQGQSSSLESITPDKSSPSSLPSQQLCSASSPAQPMMGPGGTPSSVILKESEIRVLTDVLSQLLAPRRDQKALEAPTTGESTVVPGEASLVNSEADPPQNDLEVPSRLEDGRNVEVPLRLEDGRNVEVPLRSEDERDIEVPSILEDGRDVQVPSSLEDGHDGERRGLESAVDDEQELRRRNMSISRLLSVDSEACGAGNDYGQNGQRDREGARTTTRDPNGRDVIGIPE